ncbi:MAG TPA: hypothetical protein PKC28_11730 [Bdellovibrionales bacterium]|nr:hypothetical protein [Bdellovibrionales bacterium]
MGFARGALALFILAGFSVAAAASEPPVRRFADKSTMSLYEMASRAVVSAFRACPVEMAMAAGDRMIAFLPYMGTANADEMITLPGEDGSETHIVIPASECAEQFALVREIRDELRTRREYRSRIIEAPYSKLDRCRRNPFLRDSKWSCF